MKCETCGIEFTPKKKDIRIKFCSADCRIKFRNKTKYTTEWTQKNREHLKAYRQSILEKRNTDRRNRYATDPEYREKLKAKVIANNHKHPLTKRKNRLRTMHGLTIEDYNTMLIKQDNKCAICGTKDPKNKLTNYFYIDHNHATGKIRGLLCSSCNLGLGKFKDNPKLLLIASKYLER